MVWLWGIIAGPLKALGAWLLSEVITKLIERFKDYVAAKKATAAKTKVLSDAVDLTVAAKTPEEQEKAHEDYLRKLNSKP